MSSVNRLVLVPMDIWKKLSKNVTGIDSQGLKHVEIHNQNMKAHTQEGTGGRPESPLDVHLQLNQPHRPAEPDGVVDLAPPYPTPPLTPPHPLKGKGRGLGVGEGEGGEKNPEYVSRASLTPPGKRARKSRQDQGVKKKKKPKWLKV